MLGRITGAVRFREPLSFHTSLRIGGPAEIFIMPQDLDDLRYALAFAAREDMPLVVIGGGSNLLVSDRALQGVVVKLQGTLGGAEFAGDVRPSTSCIPTGRWASTARGGRRAGEPSICRWAASSWAAGSGSNVGRPRSSRRLCSIG